MTDNFPMPTRTVTFSHKDAWCCHDVLQGHLAGFAGRSETTEPWAAESLMSKLADLLLSFETGTNVQTLDLTKGELRCLQYNMPRTAYDGAMPLLLRVFAALSEFSYDMPLLGVDPDDSAERARLREWQTTNADAAPDGGA
jgi:hypothetical protein